MGRYQGIIDYYLNNGNEGVLDMLNTKYIITREGEVVERTTANGAAWFVQKVEIVNNAEDELISLGSTDLKTVAVAEEGAPRPQIDGSGILRDLFRQGVAGLPRRRALRLVPCRLSPPSNGAARG